VDEQESFTMLTDAQCRAAKPREGIYRLNDYKAVASCKVHLNSCAFSISDKPDCRDGFG